MVMWPVPALNSDMDGPRWFPKKCSSAPNSSGCEVFDTRGRQIGRVKDAALVPIIDPARIDRFLVGGGWAWLTDPLRPGPIHFA